MEKDISRKWKPKGAGVAMLVSDKRDLELLKEEKPDKYIFR